MMTAHRARRNKIPPPAPRAFPGPALRGLRRGSDRMVGCGQSMILQGAFLMAFDLVLWWSHRHIERALWDALE